MLRILNKIRSLGTISDAPPSDSTITARSGALQHVVDNNFAHSLSIRHVDAGSCNGCELELHALSNAYYSIERYGIQFTASPRHADVLLVTGPVTSRMREPLLTAYNAMPDPRRVAALGDCALGCNLLGTADNIVGPLERLLPVDLRIPGCPPTPDAIAQALLGLIDATASPAG